MKVKDRYIPSYLVISVGIGRLPTPKLVLVLKNEPEVVDILIVK